MKKELTNYAFIDGQNLNLGIKSLGWKLDFKKFRIYLEEKYAVKKHITSLVIFLKCLTFTLHCKITDMY